MADLCETKDCRQCYPDALTICYYCGLKPIAEQYRYSCAECVYTCAGCKQVTPYESGGADDMPQHCDKCWHDAQKI